MASSAADHAGNRVREGRDDIEAALKEADAGKALSEATEMLRSAWKHMSKHRKADAAIAAAQLAASITVTAGRLHTLKPHRPEGCPAVPGPDDLLAAYRGAVAEGSTR